MLTNAIRQRRVVRLGYSRQSDGVLSLHFVAPVDIRPGVTARTATTMYVWAYCFDASEAEMHLLHRVRSVAMTPDTFDPPAILRLWPAKWPLPRSWFVQRDW